MSTTYNQLGQKKFYNIMEFKRIVFKFYCQTNATFSSNLVRLFINDSLCKTFI